MRPKVCSDDISTCSISETVHNFLSFVSERFRRATSLDVYFISLPKTSRDSTYTRASSKRAKAIPLNLYQKFLYMVVSFPTIFLFLRLRQQCPGFMWRINKLWLRILSAALTKISDIMTSSRSFSSTFFHACKIRLSWGEEWGKDLMPVIFLHLKSDISMYNRQF